MASESIRTEPRSDVQKASLAFGVVFLLVGLAGFIPGLTSDFDRLEFAGPDSGAMLLGMFEVSWLHNLVHLAYGVVGVAAARTAAWSRMFLVAGGAVYGLLWVYGLVIDKDSAANFVPLNTADDWLHFGLAVAMIGLGLALGNRMARPATRDR